MEYRADIDGLRGIAIILVLFFHFEIGGIDNGFLGVDIFFVISGFLITQLISKEITTKKFSISEFYCRRIRRLFPALFFMLVIVSLASFIFFDRASFEKFGFSLITTSLFASNIWFWTETGYFAPSALEKPLLHTWSLSVEEQFYIFFPLLLLLFRRFLFPSPLLIITTLFILSLLLYLYGFYYHPDATFFLLPTRIWQLLAGSIIALLHLNRRRKLKNLGFHTLGASLVLISLFPQFISALKIPPAIPCTVGTALILLPIQNSWIVKVLSLKPLIWIGLLSYSLYLWHWPIYVFCKYLSFENIDTIKKLILVLLSLFFAWCSWRYIESPFRKMHILPRNKKYFFIPAGSFLSVCILFGIVIIHKEGMAFRHPQRDIIEAQSFWDWHPYGKSPRFHHLELSQNFSDVDIIGSEYAAPEFLLWGDSHAMAFIPGLEIAARKNNCSFYCLTRSGNPPLLNYQLPGQELLIDNSALNKNILDFIKSNNKIKTIILACAWADYRENYKLQNDPIGTNTINFFNSRFSETIDTLNQLNKNIVVFSQVPPLAVNNFSTRYYFLKTRFPFLYDDAEMRITTSVKNYESKFSNFNEFINSFKNKNFMFLDLNQYFHNNDSSFFIFEQNGIPLYRDAGHLSTYGSEMLSMEFSHLFSQNPLSQN